PWIGSWDETVRYFQERSRGYAVHGGALHRVEASHPEVEAVWPLAAEVVGGDSLLRRLLPLPPGLPGSVHPPPPPPRRRGRGRRPATAPCRRCTRAGSARRCRSRSPSTSCPGCIPSC